MVLLLINHFYLRNIKKNQAFIYIKDNHNFIFFRCSHWWWKTL